MVVSIGRVVVSVGRVVVSIGRVVVSVGRVVVSIGGGGGRVVVSVEEGRVVVSVETGGREDGIPNCWPYSSMRRYKKNCLPFLPL